MVRSVLTIRNVLDYSVDDRSRIGTYSFNTMSYHKGAVVITCSEDLDLRMIVSGIDIESRDLEIRGKARITHGLFWMSDTGRVYE